MASVLIPKMFTLIAMAPQFGGYHPLSVADGGPIEPVTHFTVAFEVSTGQSV